MYGYCEEIEVRDEVENLKEIHKKWPHLVEAHIASLHEDVRERVRSRWRVLVWDPDDSGRRYAHGLTLQEMARSRFYAGEPTSSPAGELGLFGSLFRGF